VLTPSLVEHFEAVTQLFLAIAVADELPYREKMLDAFLFELLDKTGSVSGRWLLPHNHERPHTV
jgi:hypothetical protein